MSKPYKSWEFCEYIKCYAMSFGKSFRVKAICSRCPAYQMHQYLKEHGQMLEEGSELERIVTAAKTVLKILERGEIEIKEAE